VYFVEPGATSADFAPTEVAEAPHWTGVDTASSIRPGLAFMQNGEPIVCWAHAGLHCAIRANGAWTRQGVAADGDYRGEVEVRVAPNGCCHVAYQSQDGAVRHATDC
jgi:hypothetical protein